MMDADTLHDTTVSVVEGDPGSDNEEISNGGGTLEEISSDKDDMREVGSALIRLELDLACTSEKLVNMNLLMMHVVARESDYEAFVSDKEEILVDSAVKAMEFDVLSGIFDSEVREMDRYICWIQREITNACEVISSHKHLGDVFSALEEKLHDAEESLKQSQEQVSELMMQSAKFQKILPRSTEGETCEDKDVVISEDEDFLSTTAKIKMQTSQQQRHILQMLEKSLARELDLDEKLTECTQALDELKLKLRSSRRELLSMEEETTAIYAQFLEADNASAVLMGTSKELMGRLQVCQFRINSAVQRENDLNVRLEKCMQNVQRLEKEKAGLQELAEKNNLEALTLKEKVNSLEEQLKASETMPLDGNASLDVSNERVKDLEEKIAVAESRAEKAENECKLLAETNKRLKEEIDLLKDSGISGQKVDSLEKQLAETNIQLQMAIASVEASQEKQTMLYSTITDMEALIENLKSKVSKADTRADSAEDKCIILSENNAELQEELNFLRSKLECLEASLQQAEESKLETAKGINIHTKMITNLVMQLAIERERLHKQICLLASENRALISKLNMANKGASKFDGGEDERGAFSSEHGATSRDSGKGNQGEVSDTTEVKLPTDVLDGECEPDTQDLKSDLETVRTIDPGRLSMKHVLLAILTALVAVLAVCYFQAEHCPL